MRNYKNNYSDDWKNIADKIKDIAGWKCENCGQKNSSENGCRLTVHHIDGNKANNDFNNLVALCQRCHLSIQAKFGVGQQYLFEKPSWAVKRGLI